MDKIDLLDWIIIAIFATWLTVVAILSVKIIYASKYEVITVTGEKYITRNTPDFTNAGLYVDLDDGTCVQIREFTKLKGE